MQGWIACDLDGTLAYYDRWRGAEHIGEPIPAMLERVKAWIAEGREVRIFTARVWHDRSQLNEKNAQLARLAIQQWCAKHIGRVLPVTNEKDYDMIALFDDRCAQVEANTGRLMIAEAAVST